MGFAEQFLVEVPTEWATHAVNYARLRSLACACVCGDESATPKATSRPATPTPQGLDAGPTAFIAAADEELRRTAAFVAAETEALQREFDAVQDRFLAEDRGDATPVVESDEAQAGPLADTSAETSLLPPTKTTTGSPPPPDLIAAAPPSYGAAAGDTSTAPGRQGTPGKIRSKRRSSLERPSPSDLRQGRGLNGTEGPRASAFPNRWASTFVPSPAILGATVDDAAVRAQGQRYVVLRQLHRRAVKLTRFIEVQLKAVRRAASHCVGAAAARAGALRNDDPRDPIDRSPARRDLQHWRGPTEQSRSAGDTADVDNGGAENGRSSVARRSLAAPGYDAEELDRLATVEDHTAALPIPHAASAQDLPKTLGAATAHTALDVAAVSLSVFDEIAGMVAGSDLDDGHHGSAARALLDLAEDIKRFAIVACPAATAHAAEETAGSGGAFGTWVVRWPFVAAAAVVFAVMLLVPILDDRPEAHHCLAMLAAIVVLWVTEAAPFFATALCIPVIAVPLGVLPGLSRHDAGTKLLGATFDHTQMLVLGGLSLGKALSKHHLEVYAARLLLRRAAPRPALYLLAVMLLSVVACATVSNVAAPVLLLGLLQPSLWDLPSDSPAPKAILLGLALACNFGGMLTPIASPQNAVALQVLGSRGGVGFLPWTALALPVVLVGVVTAWGLILVLLRPFRGIDHIPMPLATSAAGAAELTAPGAHPSSAAASPSSVAAALSQGEQRQRLVEIVLIAAVSVVTLALWCWPGSPFGDTGVTALIPVVVFFGLGVLTKHDFNAMPWHLLFLLAGGNMLGVCTRDSGLLAEVVSVLTPFLKSHAPWVVVIVLMAAIAAVTTLVSHTVASLILLPVVAELSAANPDLPSSQALVVLSVLMCSGAMAFPISSFPNVNSLLAEDVQGRPYLTVKSFLFPGACMTVLTLAALVSYMPHYADLVL